MKLKDNILFISDIQTYHRPNSYESGRSNLNVTLEALKEVFEVAKQHNADIIHTGDLFEYARPKEFTRVRMINFFKYACKETNFITNVGNHDLYRRLRWEKPYPITALHTISEAIPNFVVSNWDSSGSSSEKAPGHLRVNDTSIYLLPYFYLEADFKYAVMSVKHHHGLYPNKNLVLGMHQDLKEFIFSSEISYTDQMFKPFTMVFNGHLHERGEVANNFIITGSLLQQKGGDKTEVSKGMYLMRTATENLEYIALSDNYPKFVSYPHGEEVKPEHRGQYILRYNPNKNASFQNIEIISEDTTLEGRKDIVNGYLEGKGLQDEGLSEILESYIDQLVDNEITEKVPVAYHWVELEGFRSYGNPVRIPLDAHSFTQYLGDNGAGKSTPFRALYWCETGKSMTKRVKQEDMVTEEWMQSMCENWKGTRVMVCLSIRGYKYVLVRHIKYKGETFGHVGGSSFMVFRMSEVGPEDLQERASLVDLSKLVPEVLQHGLDQKDNKLRDTKLWERWKGIPHTLMLNSIIFDSNTVRSVLSTDAEKSKLIDAIVDVEWVSTLKILNTLQIETVKKEIQELEDIKIPLLDKEIAGLEAQLEQANKTLELFEQDKQDKMLAIKKELLLIHSDRLDVEDQLKELRGKTFEEISVPDVDELKVQVEDCKIKRNIQEKKSREATQGKDRQQGVIDTQVRNLDQTNTVIDRIKQEIEQLQKDILNVDISCPTCGGDLPTHMIQTAKDSLSTQVANKHTEKEKLSLRVLTCKETLEEAKKVYLDYQKQYQAAEYMLMHTLKPTHDQLQKELNNIYKIKDEALKLEREKLLNQTEIDKHTNTLSSIDNKIADRRTRLKELNEQKPPVINIEVIISKTKAMNAERELYLAISKEKETLLSTYKTINTKVLHARGLQMFALQNKIHELNQFAKAYADIAGISIEFYLDESLRYRINVEVDGRMRDVAKLSDGQTTLANLIWIFSLNDLMRTQVPCEFLFLDEPYTNLDPDYSAKVGDVIRMKAENTYLHLITHSQQVDVTGIHQVNVLGGKTYPTHLSYD